MGQGARSCTGLAVVTALWAAVGGAESGLFSAYRIRLARGTEPPRDLYGNPDGSAWEVREVNFFSDAACQATLEVVEPLASVGQETGRAADAFDGVNSSAWSSACEVSQDAANACQDSWRNGAWLGGRLAQAQVLRCVRLLHKPLATGLLLEGWLAAFGDWTPLQEFAPPSAEEVWLLRVQGGGCTEARVQEASGQASSEALLELPRCTNGTQWRLVMEEVVLSWTVYELEFYRDAGCTQLAADGLPISVEDEPLALRRLADGDSATAWAASCANSDREDGGRCSRGRLWVGMAFSQATDIRCIQVAQDFQVRYGSGSSNRGRLSLQVWRGALWEETQLFGDVTSGGPHFLPRRIRDDNTMWRLVNDNMVTAAWVVYDLVFMADEACTEPLVPAAFGGIFSSDGSVKDPTETHKAFDGDDKTFWSSSCAPCQPGDVYLGFVFDTAVEVRCVRLMHGSDDSYWPSVVRLEAWQDTGTTGGWRQVRTYPRLQSGLQYLTRTWESAGTRFMVQNEVTVPSGWRVAELRLFRDASCTERVQGLGFGSDGDAADVARAFDDDTDTFWHMDCCRDYQGLDECPGCIARQAWLGVILLGSDTVQCVRLLQMGGLPLPAGAEQPRGPLLFASEGVSLQQWTGFRFEGMYEWGNIPASEWVELSVGKQRSAVGSSLGCTDIDGWSACSSNRTCAHYKAEGHCGTPYLDEEDCNRLTMQAACRRSCCLCDEAVPEHCADGGILDISQLPPWLIPAAAGGAGGLLLSCVLSGALWKRRSCHKRRGCRTCCRCLDRLAKRKPPPADQLPRRRTKSRRELADS